PSTPSRWSWRSRGSAPPPPLRWPAACWKASPATRPAPSFAPRAPTDALLGVAGRGRPASPGAELMVDSRGSRDGAAPWRHIDLLLVAAVAGILGIGLLMVYSSTRT